MLTVKDIAERLKISEAVVYGWCGQGLTHYRMGAKGRRGCIRIAEADLAAWLEKLKTQKGQEDVKPPAPKIQPLKLHHLKVKQS
jgi:excisionase family DNA binding protein